MKQNYQHVLDWLQRVYWFQFTNILALFVFKKIWLKQLLNLLFNKQFSKFIGKPGVNYNLNIRYTLIDTVYILYTEENCEKSHMRTQ